MVKRKFNYTFLTSKEAAKFLDMSPEAVNVLARKNEIPAVKVGRQWRFKKRAVTLFKKNMQRNLAAA